ncbi:MAG: hypothetical protein QOI34_561, partial [Verrucomicrobiota bacterium]
MMRPKIVASFGVWLLLAMAITVPSLIAQDNITSLPLDLKYESLGLVNTVTDMEGAGKGLNKSARDVAGQIQGMEVKETDLEIKINLSGDILFDFDKADLRPAAEPVLAQVVAQIQKYPRGKVLIEGHTDAKGNQPYN